MMRLITALSALCLVAALGCEKKETAPTPAEQPATAASPAPASTPAAVAEPVIDLDSLPVEEQYEAEAEKEITAANLTAKLDELEKELSAP
jgi:hypothetical protein